VRILGLAAVLSTGCAHVPLPTATPEQVAAAQSRTPGVTFESLEAARVLAQEKCSGCHAVPKPTKEDVDEWPDVMSKMGKKAKLSADQTAAVTAYLQAVDVVAE
jgi:hypothetical protein